VRAHLYEFRSANRKLSCVCGWERTMKTTDETKVKAIFNVHCAEMKAAG
jgi:hypothetical protein